MRGCLSRTSPRAERRAGATRTVGVPVGPHSLFHGAVLVGLVLTAGAGHVVYPVLLHLWTRRLDDEQPVTSLVLPSLTVVVPAYREQAVIGPKVDDVRRNGYPSPLEILVVADDPETASAARATGACVIGPGDRLGKAEAINQGMGAAENDIVVITDANTVLLPGSLAAMARWFADPSVGAVAGEKTVTAGGEGAYWRFEAWLKRRESRTGTTFALVGELAAVRKGVFRPLPDDLAVEDLWLALDVLEQGLRIVYEPAARAKEDAPPGWAENWERRTRVVSGVLDVLWRRRHLLAPARGMLALQLWGHRAARCSLAPVAHLVLLVRALRLSRRSRMGRVVVVLHVMGGVAAARTQRQVPQSALARLVGQALFLQAVGLGGFVRYLRGNRPALWPKPPRPAPQP